MDVASRSVFEPCLHVYKQQANLSLRLEGQGISLLESRLDSDRWSSLVQVTTGAVKAGQLNGLECFCAQQS
eukprot:3097297-Amphidinium_carterae.1